MSCPIGNVSVQRDDCVSLRRVRLQVLDQQKIDRFIDSLAIGERVDKQAGRDAA